MKYNHIRMGGNREPFYMAEFDLVAIVRVNAPAELDACLDAIGSIEGVRDTNSAIVLSTKFDRR